MHNINFNTLTGRTDAHLSQFNQFQLEVRTLDSFLKLQKELAIYDIDLQIVSAYRSFERQLSIWNDKVEGKRKLYDSTGNLLDYNSLSEEEILQSILTWSAIPGASRHHWGTDLDVFDKNIKEKSQVDLNNQEYETDFKTLTTELTNKISSNNSYSFFRPYAEDLGGVSKELWHLSFGEVSSIYFKEYTFEIFKRNLQESDIFLKKIILKDLEFYYKNYLLNITS